MSITAIDTQVYILAGGNSSRMGQDKGLLKWKGKAFAEHILENLRIVFEDIVLISNKPSDYSHFDCTIIEDKIKNVGPLGGLYTGLYHSKKSMSLFVPCDTPLMSSLFFQYLLKNSKSDKINFCIAGEKIHPLPVLLSTSFLMRVEESIKDKMYKLRQFYFQNSYNQIDIFSYSRDVTNINTAEEYNSLISQL